MQHIGGKLFLAVTNVVRLEIERCIYEKLEPNNGTDGYSVQAA